MAMVFQSVVTATIRAKSATSTDTYSIPGVTAGTTTATNAATQINKIFDIGGLAIVADEYMYRTIKQEVVEE